MTTHQDGRATLWRRGWGTPPDLLPGATYEGDESTVSTTGRPWVAVSVHPSEESAARAVEHGV